MTNVGTASKTLAQHWSNVGSVTCISSNHARSFFTAAQTSVIALGAVWEQRKLYTPTKRRRLWEKQLTRAILPVSYFIKHFSRPEARYLGGGGSRKPILRKKYLRYYPSITLLFTLANRSPCEFMWESMDTHITNTWTQYMYILSRLLYLDIMHVRTSGKTMHVRISGKNRMICKSWKIGCC